MPKLWLPRLILSSFLLLFLLGCENDSCGDQCSTDNPAECQDESCSEANRLRSASEVEPEPQEEVEVAAPQTREVQTEAPTPQGPAPTPQGPGSVAEPVARESPLFVDPEPVQLFAARDESGPGFDEFGDSSVARPVPSSGDCSSQELIQTLPPRSGDLSDGTPYFEDTLDDKNGVERDQLLVAQMRRGNFPESLRYLQPVTLSEGLPSAVTICVMPDYLALGSQRDHVRFPLGLPAVVSLLSDWEFILPTVPMVNAIYASADAQLSPLPLDPGPQMTTSGYILDHDRDVDDAAIGAHGLLAGHKKDIVIANRLMRNPGKIAIYGWHRSVGDPIQPLSTVHGENYADYSQGVRLVSRYAFVDGEVFDLLELLRSREYHPGLNSDGPLVSDLFQN